MSSKKIGFYIRVSTEEQAENPEGSIKNQRERLQQTVRLKNHEQNFGEVVDIYIDRAKSGKNTRRPELQRMLKDIKNKRINLVMSSELSRVSRSIKDFSDIWEMMKSNGCGFLSLRENFDTTTAAGEMVLYTLANLAQFERRQVSERVTANMNSRASRGLYNGGPVPIGYKLNPEKPGTLVIDPETVSTVKKAFEVMLKEESLSTAARWLNDNGYRLKKSMQGGGSHSRNQHLTTDNLYQILTNKAYIAIRDYKELGVSKEAQAQWAPIISRAVFDRVQKKLKNNRSKKKPHTDKRYPYLLSGLIYCATCKGVMCGKSAHGNGGKIGYYEHSWATKRDSTLSKKIFQCEPHRVLSKKLEPLVIEKVKLLILDRNFAENLFSRVCEKNKDTNSEKELKTLKAKLYGLNGQLEALAERLSGLPLSISPAPIYKQMELLEERKVRIQAEIDQMKSNVTDTPFTHKDFEAFREALKKLWQEAKNAKLQSQLIQRLIHKIEISPSTVKIHYYAGLQHFSEILLDTGSNSLTSGTRDRT